MFKNLIVCGAALSVVLASAGMAWAAPAPQAATVTKDFGCNGFVPGGGGLFTTESHSVVTSSGVTSLICKFDIPAGGEPAKATHADGFRCNTFLGSTTESRMVASPGGNATLTCKINPGS